MLNGDDEIRLSSAEIERVIELATAQVDRILAQLSRTEATLNESVFDCEDRAALLERIRRRRQDVEQIRVERIEHLFERLQAGAPIDPGSDADCRISTIDYEVIRRDGMVVSFAPAFSSLSTYLDACVGEWVIPVAKYFQSLILRWKAFRRARLLRAAGGRSSVHPHTRSLASRSRLIAPVGAPPSVC